MFKKIDRNPFSHNKDNAPPITMTEPYGPLRYPFYSLSWEQKKHPKVFLFFGCNSSNIIQSLNIQYQSPQILLLQSLTLLLTFPFPSSPYKIVAPTTKDNPTDMTIDMKPTARLSASISSSIRNVGVRNSKIK